MKTKEEIIQSMVDMMPFDLHEKIKPYIYEAMEIYAKEKVEAEKEEIREWLRGEDFDGLAERL